MIKLENISKSYGNNIIFDNFSLLIPVNKKVMLKGENGIGKSVLMKIIVGYTKAEKGEVYYDNLKIGDDYDFIPDAGVSINAPEFISSWTGLENLEYLANIRKKIDKEGILKLVDTLGMIEYIHKKYKTYSLGMKQKLRIIQAIMDQPLYLILDEPFDALDTNSKEIVKNLLETYINEHANSTLIYTSHSETDETYADIIYRIEKDHVVTEKK